MGSVIRQGKYVVVVGCVVVVTCTMWLHHLVLMNNSDTELHHVKMTKEAQLQPSNMVDEAVLLHPQAFERKHSLETRARFERPGSRDAGTDSQMQIESRQTVPKDNVANGHHTEANVPKPKRPKIYVYDVPSTATLDVVECLKILRCFNLSMFGFGERFYQEDDMGVYSTNQFSLEVVLHNQFLYSDYRTLDPETADVFYLPSYLSLLWFCPRIKFGSHQDDLYKFIKTMPYFKQGKPHFSTIAKIERESSLVTLPILGHPDVEHITYFTIEREAKDANRMLFNILRSKTLVVPYPSYVHRNRTAAISQEIKSPSLPSRNVLVFLAASERRSNGFRNIFIDQFKTKVKLESYDMFFQNPVNKETDMIMLITKECYPYHENTTIQWMQKSVFCLQPHGDSPTRKSFYDSIQSGCIPVIFTFPDEDVVYPFQNFLNYTDFVVKLDSLIFRRNPGSIKVYDVLKNIPQEEVKRLHTNLISVARKLQYSHPQTRPRFPEHRDALDMIVQDIAHLHGLEYT